MNQYIETIIVTVLSSSIILTILQYIFEKRKKKQQANFEMKLKRYQNIIAYLELYLHPSEAKYAVRIDENIQYNDDETNKRIAWTHILVNRGQVYLITRDKKVHCSYEKFLVEQTEENYKDILLKFSKDLWF